MYYATARINGRHGSFEAGDPLGDVPAKVRKEWVKARIAEERDPDPIIEEATAAPPEVAVTRRRGGAVKPSGER